MFYLAQLWFTSTHIHYLGYLLMTDGSMDACLFSTQFFRLCKANKLENCHFVIGCGAYAHAIDYYTKN